MFPALSPRGSAKRIFAAVAALLLTLAAAPGVALAQSSDKSSDISEADQKALAGYHLTLEKLDQLDATNRQIVAAIPKDPALAKELSGEGVLNTGKTLDDALAKFDSRAPHLAAVIKTSGMKERDYVMTIMSMVIAASGQMLKKYAPDKPLPAYMPADNITLAEKNSARFQEVMQNMNRVSLAAKGSKANSGGKGDNDE